MPRRPGTSQSKARSGGAGGGAASQVVQSSPQTNILSSGTFAAFPARYSGAMKYVSFYTLSSDATAGQQNGTEQVMRLNSLYDPDKTGVGHQPYSYDQISPMYGRYKVHTAIIDILATTPGGNHDMQCCIMIQGPNGGQTLTGMYGFTAEELPNVATRQLSTSGVRAARFRLRVPIYTLVGLTKHQFDANIEDYASNTNTNPAREVNLHMAANCYDNTTAQASTWRVSITYLFEMWDRKGQSTS